MLLSVLHWLHLCARYISQASWLEHGIFIRTPLNATADLYLNCWTVLFRTVLEYLEEQLNNNLPYYC